MLRRRRRVGRRPWGRPLFPKAPPRAPGGPPGPPAGWPGRAPGAPPPGRFQPPLGDPPGAPERNPPLRVPPPIAGRVAPGPDGRPPTVPGPGRLCGWRPGGGGIGLPEADIGGRRTPGGGGIGLPVDESIGPLALPWASPSGPGRFSAPPAGCGPPARAGAGLVGPAATPGAGRLVCSGGWSPRCTDGASRRCGAFRTTAGLLRSGSSSPEVPPPG